MNNEELPVLNVGLCYPTLAKLGWGTRFRGEFNSKSNRRSSFDSFAEGEPAQNRLSTPFGTKNAPTVAQDDKVFLKLVFEAAARSGCTIPIDATERHPSVAKASNPIACFAARLKSCPDTKRKQPQIPVRLDRRGRTRSGQAFGSAYP